MIRIEDYTDLAHFYSNKSNKRHLQGIELDDLYQVSMIGIWIASKSYNPDKGAFSTYAHQFILGEINELVYKITSVDGTKQRVPRIKEELLGSIVEEGVYEDDSFDTIYLKQYIDGLNLSSLHKQFFKRMVLFGDKDATDWFQATTRCSRQHAHKTKQDIREGLC